MTNRLSRRQFLAVSGTGAAGVALAACGTGSSTSEVEPAEPDGVVNWSNWIEYTDVDEESGERPTLVRFQEEKGIQVQLTEDINDNEEFYAKVRPTLEQGRDIGRDLVVLTDWMCARWINLGYSEKLNKDNIPGSSRIIERLKSPEYDPDRSYTVPWQSGFAGLGWNVPLLADLAGKSEMRTLDDLWDPGLRGRVGVVSEMRDTIGVIMLWQGNDPTDFGDDEFDQALAELVKQIDNGQIRQVQGNDYLNSLENGDIAAVIGWSGDVVALGEEYGFALPESGGTLWTDTSMVPQGAGDQADAEALLDWYTQPDIAAEVAAYVQYLCPFEGAREAMEQVDPELVDSEWIFPDDEQLSRGVIFKSLSEEEEQRYQAAFQQAIGN